MDSASLFRALLSSPSSSSSSMQCTKRMEKALERGEGRTRGKRKRRVSVSRHRGTNYYLVPADTPVELREIAPLFAEWTRTNADASSYYSISFTLLYSRSPFLSKRIVAPPFFYTVPNRFASISSKAPIFRVDGATHHLEYLRVVIASKVSIKGIVRKFRVETSICLSLFLFVATRIGILNSRGMLP